MAKCIPLLQANGNLYFITIPLCLPAFASAFDEKLRNFLWSQMKNRELKVMNLSEGIKVDPLYLYAS